MKRFVLALVCSVALVGFVMAEELTVSIQKVDAKAGTITYVSFGKGFGKKKDDAPPPETKTGKVSKGAKIANGEFNFEDKSFKAGSDLAKGLENEAFTKGGEKGVFARITVADENKGDVKKGDVTQILVISFKKKDGQ
jgi:hypothetical protein